VSAVVGALRVSLGLDSAQFQTGIARAQNGLAGLNKSTQSTTRAFRSLSGGGIQAASFQLEDFAVQVSNGTRVSTALGQQLPQLLGSFGALGAVLGAAVAVGVPLAAMLLNASFNTEELTKASDRARGSAEDLFGLIEGRGTAIDDLAKKFDGAAGAAQRLVDTQITLTSAIARSDLAQVIDGLRDFGEVGFELNEFGETVQRNIRDVERLAEAFDTTAVVGEGLAVSFERLFSAQNEQEQVAALEAINQLLAAAAAAGAVFSAEGAAVAQALTDAETAARTLASAADDVAASIAGASGEAAALADQWMKVIEAQRAARTAASIAKAAGDGAGATSSDDARRGVMNAAMPASAFPLPSDSALGARPAPKKSGGGSKRSAATTEIERQRAAVERLLQSLRDEAAIALETDEVAKEMIRIREQLKGATEAERIEVESLIRARETAILVEEATIARLDEMRDAARDAGDALADGLRRGASAGEVLSDVLGALGQRLTSLAADGLMNVLVGKRGGTSSGILGSVLTAIGIPGFAAGTRFAPGGLAVVGERGPELVNLPRGSQVVPNHALGGMGGTVVHFAPVINAAGADAAGLAQVRAELQGMRAAFPDMVARAMADPRRRGRI
jgi:hypothetical protein